MMNKPTCLIIQSGAYGDIFVTAPIAKHYYDKGYLVYWPARKPFFNLLKYFPYVHPIEITDDKYPPVHQDWLRSDTMHLEKITKSFNYDVVLNLADRSSKPQQMITETFEQYKYRIADVPFAKKNHLIWVRNIEKEHDLIGILENNYDINFSKDHFVLAHTGSSHCDNASLPDNECRKCVYINEIKGFEIPDWYKVVVMAKAVYAVESAFHQFVDGAIHKLKCTDPNKKFYLLSRSSLTTGESYTVSRLWSKKFMK